MICKRCGIGNADDNKYCINCGNELTKENQPKKSICGSCGSENKLTNKFCTVCGEKLVAQDNIKSGHDKQKHQHHNKNNKRNDHIYTPSKDYKKRTRMAVGVKPLLIAAGVLFISLLTVALLNNWFVKNDDDRYPKESKSSNPVVEAKVFEIASKFVCSCGSCGEQSLEKCKCATAVEERQFVRDYLERKSKPEDIVVALADRYGYLKAEYAKEFKVDSPKTWSSTKQRPL